MKKAAIAAAIGVLGVALAGCNLGAASPPAPGGNGGAATVTFKLADNWAATHPMSKAIDEVFKKQVEEKSSGSLKVDVYHSGTLGNEADLWDGVRNGTLEMVVVGSAMNQEFPMMLISDWPFLYRDIDHAAKTWTGEIADGVSAEFDKKFPTTHMLAWGPNSARTFTSNKPLTSVAEFQGQKFRMPNNPIHVGIAENLGGSAQVIPLGELFSSLETGVVDGQDNGMVTVISEALYEVQKYVYETNHIIATMEIIASDAFMKRLTPEQQTIVRDAAKATAESAWAEYKNSVDKDRKFLTDEGLTVTELTAADRQLMIEKIKPTLDKLYAENDWAKDLVAKIEAVK